MSDYEKSLPTRIQGAALALMAMLGTRFLWDDTIVWVLSGVLVVTIIGATFYYLGVKRKVQP